MELLFEEELDDPRETTQEARTLTGLSRSFHQPVFGVFISAAVIFSHSSAQSPSAVTLSCTTTTVGRIPINDLGTGFYQSYQGGLYPGGSNQRPSIHDSAGRAMAAQIKPLNSTGSADAVNGKVVLLSIGMSNATQEFSVFKSIADTDTAKNPKLVIVDGAQGGQTAAIIADSTANFWTVIDQRLAAAGVTRQQVQAAWIKEADANPSQAFPSHALTLKSEFESIARILKARYPNIKLSYWSSRTYGGYANTTLNPEPYAYESGFAVKWLTEKQIIGDTTLSYSGLNPKAPWLAWGPYFWADGLNPRSDSLIWLCTDFGSDGTHPSTTGRTKVAQMLLTFFKTDPTAAGWFLRSPTTSVGEYSIASAQIPTQLELEQNYPNPFNPMTTIRFSIPNMGTPLAVSLRVYDILGREVAPLLNDEKLEPGTYETTFDAHSLASGMYLYRLQASGLTKVQKMLILK